MTARTAIQSANLLSEALSPGEKARNPGTNAHETATMRRTNRLSIRPVRRLSAPFLRATIVEWLFPMHIERTLAHLQRTELLQAATINFHVR